MNTLTIHWPISKKLDPHEPRRTTYIDITDRVDTSELLFNKYYNKEKHSNYDYHKSLTFPSVHNNYINGVRYLQQ